MVRRLIPKRRAALALFQSVFSRAPRRTSFSFVSCRSDATSLISGTLLWSRGRCWIRLLINRFDLGDVVEFVYLLIDLFPIFETADVETPVFLAISAMGMPYSEKSIIAIQNRTLQTGWRRPPEIFDIFFGPCFPFHQNIAKHIPCSAIFFACLWWHYARRRGSGQILQGL